MPTTWPSRGQTLPLVPCWRFMRSLRLGELRKTEIEDLEYAVVLDNDVFRLQIPMYDAVAMSRRQAVGDLNRVADRLFELQATDELPQRLARHVLHDDERHTLFFSNVVDGDDVRVVEGGGGSGLALEALQSLRVSRPCSRLGP